jgi:hypothetical protein
MDYYTLIEKENGKIHPPLQLLTDTLRPINEEELVYAKLTDEMIECLEIHDRIIDWENTIYSNNAWNTVFIIPQKITDYLGTRNAERNRLLTIANTKLSIADASITFKTAVNNYIEQLNLLQFSNNEIQQINWPQQPW